MPSFSLKKKKKPHNNTRHQSHKHRTTAPSHGPLADTATNTLLVISTFIFLTLHPPSFSFFFFFNDTATTEIYTLSLHDALPICEIVDAHLVRARCTSDCGCGGCVCSRRGLARGK